MLIIVKIGKLEKEEISKNYFNMMMKTRIALIQMKMSSDQKKNMSSAIKKIKEACKIIGKSAKIEVSGGINLQNIKKISNIGVDFISVGQITQSAPAVKINLELENI